MNVVISIEHPAWAHQFRYIIKELEARNDKVTVLAVDKDGCLELLDSFGIDYKLMANSTGNNTFEKAWLFAKLCITYTLACKKAKADILIGRLSPMMSVAAFLTRKPHVLYDDSEVCFFGFSLARLFSTKLIVPRSMIGSQGKKEIRAPMYKEMYYLDPKHFTPDKEVVRAAGINPDEKFVLVRFVAWKASHDFGKTGLTDEQKIEFIRKLSQYAKIYISSEKKLPQELEKYRIKIPYEQIHHVMYYAQLVMSDGATMASEAVVLGTHAIRLCPIKCGTFIEQEERYHLLKWFPGATPEWFDKGLEEAVEMLKNEKLWEEGKEKRKKILEEIGDCNQFFIDEMDKTIKRNKRSRGKLMLQ